MQEKLHMTLHPGLNPPEFSTRIKSIENNIVHLDETYCYPRGGGQPGDRGYFSTEQGTKVSFAEVLPGNWIGHPIEDSNEFETGQDITCHIDQVRRNAHARMHTAQHIVSALAEDIWGAETVGNQLTVENSRVDLLFEDKSVFDPDKLVTTVNEILKRNIRVNVHEWERNKIIQHEQMRHTKFMDRIPASITELRVVEVEDVDLCPCAGTHVGNTSQIPSIRFLGKKNKGKGRVRFAYEFEI
ncbi:MAG: alanyl-tRNA editing protein [Candidatus Thalassarchaeum sp.]|nr:alanyl-tRNA editing protein [Candidatus Thalassarchaeum sp.]